MACSKLVDNLGQAVRTQLVDGLFADLLQDTRFLRVYIYSLLRFYVTEKHLARILFDVALFDKMLEQWHNHTYKVDNVQTIKGNYV
jgi:uncharacterized membrane protein YbaN (DUF454 family)